MSDKYVIKNCPNCLTYNRPKAICGFTYKTGGFKGETTSYKHCQDCTDCILKQIVDILEKEPIILDVNKEFEQMFKLARVIFAKEILHKLDIKRIEDV